MKWLEKPLMFAYVSLQFITGILLTLHGILYIIKHKKHAEVQHENVSLFLLLFPIYAIWSTLVLFDTLCGLKVWKTILFSNQNNADLYTHVNMLSYFLEKPISNHIIIYVTVYEYPEATRFSEIMIHIPKKPDASRKENVVFQITKTCWGHISMCCEYF
jgi:hypothetical protein